MEGPATLNEWRLYQEKHPSQNLLIKEKIALNRETLAHLMTPKEP